MCKLSKKSAQESLHHSVSVNTGIPFEIISEVPEGTRLNPLGMLTQNTIPFTITTWVLLTWRFQQDVLQANYLKLITLLSYVHYTAELRHFNWVKKQLKLCWLLTDRKTNLKAHFKNWPAVWSDVIYSWLWKGGQSSWAGRALDWKAARKHSGSHHNLLQWCDRVRKAFFRRQLSLLLFWLLPK